MDPLPTSEARKRFSDIINTAAYGSKRIIVTRHGRPLAAVVGVDDLQRLQLLDGVKTPDSPMEIAIEPELAAGSS